MDLSEFSYDLPKEFIAQSPLADRASSKLMILDLADALVQHAVFSAIADMFQPGDLLLLNDTKVLKARLFGKAPTGGKVEVLLIKKTGKNTFEAFVRAKNVKTGKAAVFKSSGKDLKMTVGERVSGIKYSVTFSMDGCEASEDLDDIIYSVGVAPTPPYVKGVLSDPERYQTVYAKNPGSIAAPTAGFHFTPALLESISKKGVAIRYVTLHVGIGTFLPVKAVVIEEHKMETEAYTIPPETAETVNESIKNGGRIWVVGTTTLRALESAYDNGLRPASGETALFIYPGYKFKFPFDNFITNFHLPGSTLIMLVAAITGRERILGAYEEAKKNGYRFYSFGDAMLIFRNGRNPPDAARGGE